MPTSESTLKKDESCYDLKWRFPIDNPAPFTIRSQEVQKGLIPIRTAKVLYGRRKRYAGKKIHLLNPDSIKNGNDGHALCTAGKLYGGQSNIERISAEDISLGTVQIDCGRCLKLYELNDNSVDPSLGMTKAARKPPPKKKAPPVEQKHQPDYQDDVETTDKESSSWTYIVGGIILLAIALAGMMIQ